MVAAVFRTIFAQPDPEAVAAAWDEVRDQLAASFPKVGPLMDEAKAEVLISENAVLESAASQGFTDGMRKPGFQS